MNENVNDKIDIDILKERPLHDVLAFIEAMGICPTVSPVQLCLPTILIKRNLDISQSHKPHMAYCDHSLRKARNNHSARCRTGKLESFQRNTVCNP